MATNQGKRQEPTTKRSGEPGRLPHPCRLGVPEVGSIQMMGHSVDGVVAVKASVLILW